MKTMRPSLPLLLLATMTAACAAAPNAPAAEPRNAAAPPPVATAPAAPSCVASGEPLFQVDIVTPDPATPSPFITQAIYASGAWRTANREGQGASGCFSASEVSTVQADIAAATWQLVPLTGARCFAMTRDTTEYRVNGKVVYTTRGCAGAALDPTSATSLADLEQRVQHGPQR